ncbi:MAG: hypothetical protein ACREKE_06820, partial [bacterium]
MSVGFAAIGLIAVAGARAARTTGLRGPKRPTLALLRGPFAGHGRPCLRLGGHRAPDPQVAAGGSTPKSGEPGGKGFYGRALRRRFWLLFRLAYVSESALAVWT